MLELPVTEFKTARALFEPLMTQQLFCAGVLEGLYAGRVFVDNATAPRSGLVVKDDVWWFLAGEPHNQAFNQALHTAMFDRTLSGDHGWGGMLVCHPRAWEEELPGIYAPWIPITTQRRHYTCRQLHTDWQTHRPEGIEVRFIDQSLSAEGIELQEAAANVLALRAKAPEPDRKALGFVAVQQGQVVASAVIDCIVNRGGDIGLFTNDAFRRRGLAYITAAAAIEYALAHGVEVVHWDCEAFNRGSIRTAEKLGLQFEQTHTMYTLILNPMLHEVNRAWSALEAGRYPAAMEICRQQIETQPAAAHLHFYYVLARGYAETAQPEEAIQTLTLAATLGWDGVNDIVADFSALANHPAWDGLLRQVRQNSAARQP